MSPSFKTDSNEDEVIARHVCYVKARGDDSELNLHIPVANENIDTLDIPEGTKEFYFIRSLRPINNKIERFSNSNTYIIGERILDADELQRMHDQQKEKIDRKSMIYAAVLNEMLNSKTKTAVIDWNNQLRRLKKSDIVITPEKKIIWPRALKQDFSMVAKESMIVKPPPLRYPRKPQ